MYRRFIGTIAAASITITALGALPAAAGDRETARAIAAILGLAVVGKIIHDKNKDDRVEHHRPHVQHQRPHVQKPRHANKQPRYQQKHVQPRPLPKRVNRRLLPGECLQSINTRQGRVRMFGQRCLNNNYRFARHLPNQCFEAVRTNGGKRRGYEARCLRQNGYRLAHR